MSSTEKEMSLSKTYFAEEIAANNGVIPHGGRNDAMGSYLCPECAKERHIAFVAFWATWHKANGFTKAETAEWLGTITTRYGSSGCLLYTSDAADDLTRVDLGGRRI